MDNNYNYDYERDTFYCYPDSYTLRNKLNITDADDLRKAEREITSIRIAQASQEFVQGKMDFEHLKAIHRFIFSDIYEWAGEIRKVNISKGSSFCRHEYIENQAIKIFDHLKNDNYLIEIESTESIIKRLSFYIGEINAIHPFREGNGRAQRLFIEYLASIAGYSVNFSQVGTMDMIKASALAFTCDYSKMETLFTQIITPISKEQQKFFQQSILI
jgi:cell filamentation protein